MYHVRRRRRTQYLLQCVSLSLSSGTRFNHFNGDHGHTTSVSIMKDKRDEHIHAIDRLIANLSRPFIGYVVESRPFYTLAQTRNAIIFRDKVKYLTHS